MSHSSVILIAFSVPWVKISLMPDFSVFCDWDIMGGGFLFYSFILFLCFYLKYNYMISPFVSYVYVCVGLYTNIELFLIESIFVTCVA